MVQAAVGYNTVLFPVSLEAYGFNKFLIGLCLAFEMGAVISIINCIDWILGKFGLVGTFALATGVRLVVLLLLAKTQNLPLWCMGVFFFGICTYMCLISLQTWVNALSVGRFRGLVSGCYSSALSLGTASGPILFNTFGSAGGGKAFQGNMIIVIVALLVIIPLLTQQPRFLSQGRLRIGYAIRMAKVPMLSSFVGGVTFFGLPAFLTLYGMMNGLSVQRASLLLTAFMLGSVSLGLLISSFSNRSNRTFVTILCVLVGVLCAVFLPLGIYNYVIALCLLFVWGGAAGGIYATGLSAVAELFRKEDQVSANVAYSILDNVGGIIAVLSIGFLMSSGISDGIVYVIVATALCYFIYCLAQLINTEHMA
ncbi:MFS transporter [Synechococcus lacustris L1E-Slac]|nr:MFS transporter [Synechococcus lacustris L1F-Slac]MCP9813981.1 MFS transporter [Synechococcus lacustris L1E-Slac]MCP9922954.1 MFS transporter [Synechococcus lacustris Cruz CV12-2]MCP9923752.1 MFS transporter [Synechococcus lacustris C3-12m-Tous]